MKRERLLNIYYFSIGLYTAVLFGLGFALFNVEVGAENLPFIYVIFPFLDALSAFFMARVITKRGVKTFFKKFIVVVVLIHMIILPFMFQYISSAFSYGLMLVLLIAVSENLLFTRTYLIQEVFTLEELQKWVPVAISSGAVGALVGGSILRISEGIIKSGYLFLFILPVLLLSGFSAYQLLQTVGASNREIFSRRMVTSKSIWTYTTSQTFLPLLIACVALVAISDTINEFLFHFHSTNTLNNIEQLTGFLGVFLALRYFTELILNLFIYHRLVKKLGSLNLMPFLMAISAVSLVIVSLAPQGLYFAIIGRVLSIVAVIGFLLYLLEVFYQLLDPLYRPALVTIVGYIDAFSGYAIGGGILMLNTVFGVPAYILVGTLSVVLFVFAVLWHHNKKGFIDVLNTSQSAELSGAVEDIIGASGSGSMLSTLMKQAEFGSRSERLFLLYAIKNQPVDDQLTWLSQLFDMSEMEIRISILEHVFENRIFDFNPILHSHELTEDFKNWLVSKCFINYPRLKSKPVYESLKLLLENTQAEDNAIGYMISYMFQNQRNDYSKVLEGIAGRKQLEAEQLIDEIIDAYRGEEDEAHLKWYRAGHLSKPEIISHYDPQLKYKALTAFSRITNYPVLSSVVTAYDHQTIIDHFTRINMSLIDKLYVAEAQRRKNHTYRLFKEVLTGLSFIRRQETLMDLNHKSAHFLEYELKLLRLSVESVLVDQTLERSHIGLAGRSYEYLSDARKRSVLIEMIRGIKMDKWTERLISLLEGEITDPMDSETFVRIGDSGDWIMTLIKYNRGEDMENQKRKEIDFMIALKSVPMFETLDIDTLKKLTEIVSVSHMITGDTIVKKGHRGSRFFILLKGRAAVYLNEKEPPIAIIPEGQMIGELGVINNDLRTATVKADGPVEIMSMEGDAFLELVQKNTAIGMAVIRTLSFRLTDMLKRSERG